MTSWLGDAKALALAFAATLAPALSPAGALVALPALATLGVLCASSSSSNPDPSSTSSSSSSSNGSSSSPWSSSSGSNASGELTLEAPLTLSTSVLGGGETLSGRVTFTNRTSAPVALVQLTIAVRPPGGTNSGGPFFDLAPAKGPLTLAPGASVTLAASRALPRNAALGSWRAYATYENSQGWRDGNEVAFEVVSPLPPATHAAPAAAGYTVRGNQILDAQGQPHLFHGVDRPSLEWSSQGEHLSADDYRLMASWGANVVRIAIDQDFWLKGAKLYDPTYAARIDQQIGWAHAAGLDVILDLHWSDLGNSADTKPGQQRMADENSLELWREVADRYKNDPRVLFELYNEPHDVSWDTWLHGGWTATGTRGGFQAVGMQELADAVRSTGAKNLVLVSGLDWAYDLTGVADHRVVGTNVVYTAHTYAGDGHAPSDWDGHFGFLAATDPVIVTEFGSTDGQGSYDQAFVDYAKKKGLSWTAWAWYPGGTKFPSLVSDWNGTPTAPGKVIRAALESYANTPDPTTPGFTGMLGGLGH